MFGSFATGAQITLYTHGRNLVGMSFVISKHLQDIGLLQRWTNKKMVSVIWERGTLGVYDRLVVKMNQKSKAEKKTRRKREKVV